MGVSRRPSRGTGGAGMQLPLPGMDPPPEMTDRLFFAVLPDAGTAGQIARFAGQLRNAHGLRGRPLEAGRLHVSLVALGDHPGVPLALVAAACQAALAVAVTPFMAGFDRVLSFTGKARARPVVLVGSAGTAGFFGLRQALAGAMQERGFQPLAASGFNPHLTLLYDAQQVAEAAVAPVGWMVREFVLVHSRIGQNLPYALLGRWPLHN